MEQDRRTFLSTALAAAPLFIPRRAWGANDRLAYGLIGAGGRGRYLNRNFQKLGAACVAVSEVYEPNMQAALKDAPDAKHRAQKLHPPTRRRPPRSKKLDLAKMKFALSVFISVHQRLILSFLSPRSRLTPQAAPMTPVVLSRACEEAVTGTR